jgi:hypothetical protein
MSGGFQQQVYSQPAQAVAGDFASANPWWSMDAGPGGLVAGAAGLVVGRFAWTYPPLDPNSAPTVALNSGGGLPDGFVSRHQQGLNTTFLSDAGMTILQGLPVTLMTGGDFWCVNSGSAQATKGMKAFANFLTGLVSFAAAGSTPGGASDSGGAVVSTTLTVTGSVSGNILTVTAVGAGTVYPGAYLNSNATGTVQPYGTAGTTGTGGTGTYALDVGEQSVAAGTTIGGKYGVYTVGTATGTFAVGMVLSGGTTLLSGASLTTLISGTGGNGSTFAVAAGTTAQTSHALVGSTSIETKWYATSGALTGELIKISSQPPG